MAITCLAGLPGAPTLQAIMPVPASPQPTGEQPGSQRFLNEIQVAGNHFQKSQMKLQDLVIFLIIPNELCSRNNMQNLVYKTRLLEYKNMQSL